MFNFHWGLKRVTFVLIRSSVSTAGLMLKWAPPWSGGSVLDHRSLPPVFESWCGHIWRLFHLWLRLITFGGCLAHLAYHVHKSGRKTSITKPCPLNMLSWAGEFSFTSMPKTNVKKLIIKTPLSDTDYTSRMEWIFLFMYLRYDWRILS